MRLPALAALLIAALSPAAGAQPFTYQIDPAHTSAQFAVRHMMVSNVRGSFNKTTGSAVWDPSNLAACKLEATIDVGSVNTGQAKRDEHLRTADFFDVAKYPTMTFRSTRCQRTGGKLQIVGDLTLHGVTKPVTLDVEGPSAEIKDPRGGYRIGASATTRINRKEFGLTYHQLMETGGLAVGDEVTITIDVELVRK